MLNSPAFESLKRLPRMGLPHYSFIILQSFQTNSDTVWVIINHSHRLLSQGLHVQAWHTRCSKLTALQSLFLLIMLFWKEKRKKNNFQRLVGVFFLPSPPSIMQEKALCTHRVSSPRNGL